MGFGVWIGWVCGSAAELKWKGLGVVCEIRRAFKVVGGWHRIYMFVFCVTRCCEGVVRI